jgi:hypothetical protein
VTEDPGLSYRQQRKLLGNAVAPAQGAYALWVMGAVNACELAA